MGSNRQLRGGRLALPCGRRPVTEESRISINDRLQQFREGPSEVLTFEASLSNHDRAVVHELCRKMGMRSKSYGKGEQRCVSVFKTGRSQKGQKGQKGEPSQKGQKGQKGEPSQKGQKGQKGERSQKGQKGKKGKKGQEGLSQSVSLAFSVETQEVLRELFIRYPPTEFELAGKVEDVPTAEKAHSKPSKKLDSSFCKPSMSQAEIAKQVEMLALNTRKSPYLQQIAADRAKLPIACFKDEITSVVESHQVVLIAGETGCGKTTQVPQFILDHMWSQGKSCKILCSQPRRISATSVAERIATERGEKVGATVGYQIRLESKGGKLTSLMFCTNGVLLRKLISAGTPLSETESKWESKKTNNADGLDATHIIVDEIHERDRYADFTLAVLRDLLPRRPDLHLILMSATLDAELFSNYFNGCPIINVPGFTHPVQSYYLEDVLALVESGSDVKVSNGDSSKTMTSGRALSLSQEDVNAMDEAIGQAWLEDDYYLLMDMIAGDPRPQLCNYQHSLTGATPLMVTAGRGRVDDVSLLLSVGADYTLQAQDGSTALEWAEREHQDEAAGLIRKHMEEKLQSAADEEQLLRKYLATVDIDEVDVELIEKLLKKICNTHEQGAVLVFLPGWEEISQTRERLQASPIFQDGSKYLILPLHSMVPSAQQRKVFKRPPPGIRKIVLATNIAETAITIDDIVFVIDSGRMKEKSYDPYNNVSTLQATWISKASVKQREGRAGRCQPGICYHLFSRIRAASLPDYQVPEIKRTPLEELCLQVKLLDPDCKISDFISKTIDPPVGIAIRNAVVLLQDIGALTDNEELTELGKQLGSLPVHPSTSKMLLFAILMNCLDPALTVACAAGYREPFVLPMAPNEKKQAFAAKLELTAAYGGYSDHLAVIAAFDGWRKAKAMGREAEARFCAKYFVSTGIMIMLDGMRKQLQRELARKGFVHGDVHRCSLNAQHQGIVRAVLVAGLYPMVGTLLPARGNRASIQIAKGEKVRIHPHSANFRLTNYNLQIKEFSNQPLLIFDEITRAEAWVYIKNCTLVKPYPLLLLATEMVVAPLDLDEEMDDEDDEIFDSEDEDEDEDGNLKPVAPEKQRLKIMSSPDKALSIVVDRWLRFQATSLDAAQLYCLRERLSAAIKFKIKHPQKILPPILGESVFAIACMLSYDGGLDVNAPQKRENQNSNGNTGTVSGIHEVGSIGEIHRTSNRHDQQGLSSATVSRTPVCNDHGAYSQEGPNEYMEDHRRHNVYIQDNRGIGYLPRSGPSISPGNRAYRGHEYGSQQISFGLQRNVRQQYVPVCDGRGAVRDQRMGDWLQDTPMRSRDIMSKNARSYRGSCSKRPRGSGLG